MAAPDPNRKKEDFFGKLSGLLDAGPEPSILPERKKRRVEDIVGEVCSEQVCGAQKTQPVRPWVYDDYLVRLKTFKASTWFAMPPEISPLECARQGWTNSGPSTLKCLSCGVEITHPDGVSASDFRASLSTRHERYCGWNDNPSSESFCYFQLNSATAYREKFSVRCRQLVQTLCEEGSAVGDALGHFMLKNLDCSGMSRAIEKSVGGSCDSVLSSKSLALELLDLNHKGVVNPGEVLDQLRSGGQVSFPLKLVPEGLCLDKEDEPEAAKMYMRKIISAISIIAIFGWAPVHLDDPDHSTGVELCCDTCGRTVSLNSETDSAPFNAINQHRFFCPWTAVNKLHPCGWELYMSNVFDSSGTGIGGSGPPVVTVSGVTGSPTISSTTSSPFSVDRSAHGVSSGKKEPLDMFKKIQSVMSMLSSSPYYSSSKK